jgi:hypothetical protein
MSIDALISTIILVVFVVTIVIAIGSYLAYKVREGRRPRAPAGEDGDAPSLFFERVAADDLRPGEGEPAP